jgi:hypothetical protein
VAHAYNPSYSEGRDQEDHSLTGEIVWETLSLKNPSQKRTDGVAQTSAPTKEYILYCGKGRGQVFTEPDRNRALQPQGCGSCKTWQSCVIRASSTQHLDIYRQRLLCARPWALSPVPQKPNRRAHGRHFNNQTDRHLL